jgi:hypothetical protein
MIISNNSLCPQCYHWEITTPVSKREWYRSAHDIPITRNCLSYPMVVKLSSRSMCPSPLTTKCHAFVMCRFWPVGLDANYCHCFTINDWTVAILSFSDDCETERLLTNHVVLVQQLMLFIIVKFVRIIKVELINKCKVNINPRLT